MRFLQLSSLLVALCSSNAGVSAVECGETNGGVCAERVQVNASTAISGLIDDVPDEVYEAFVIASTECLQCVDESSVEMLSRTRGGSGHGGCSANKCKGCGKQSETWMTCRSCCGECRCMGCDYNLGPGANRKCDDCCDDGRRMLRAEAAEQSTEDDVNFNINVCMDNVNPLDSTSSQYLDHTQMLSDFETELEACYADTERFMASWSSLCADSGIDLSLMARRDSDGSSTIMFGSTDFDSENAVVSTSSSDDTHRSTSHVMFYSALGFVALSAFAVVGTAVVVKVLNKRKAAEEEQAALWVSEMASVVPVDATTSS